MHAYILAGGFATRLWPLTEEHAKPLLPLAGKPIISYIVDMIPENVPVTVSTNAAFEQPFLEWQKDYKDRDVRVNIESTHDDDSKLGALGSLAEWINTEKIDEDIMLLTGDNYFSFPFQRFLDAQTPNVPLIAAYDVQDKERAKAFGTVILEDDGKTIKAFEEKPMEPKSTLVSTGCTTLPRNTHEIVLQHAIDHPDDVGGIFEGLKHNGHTLECFQFDDLWFDIGSFQAYLDATMAIVGEQVLKGAGAHLDENTEIDGTVVLGPGCRVKNCRLNNVVLFEGCVLEDCTLEHCIIDRHCRLTGVDLEDKILQAETEMKM